MFQPIIFLQWLMQFYDLNFKKYIQISWEPTSFPYLSIVNILYSINANFLQFLCTTIWNDKYNYAKVQKVFWISKKKLTKYKVIPNYGAQNEVLDMANFEINFLMNCN